MPELSDSTRNRQQAHTSVWFSVVEKELSEGWQANSTLLFTDSRRRRKELNVSRPNIHFYGVCFGNASEQLSGWSLQNWVTHLRNQLIFVKMGFISYWPCQQLCKANLLVQWLIISSSYMKLTKVNSVKKYLISDFNPKNCTISLASLIELTRNSPNCLEYMEKIGFPAGDCL